MRRKAVLVAISYEGQQGEDGNSFFLPAPLDELPRMVKFLVERRDFAAEDIVILSDNSAMEHIRPTCENILGQLKALMAGAASGDHFFFWYNGHGGQVANENGTESDNRDEFIYPVDWSHDETKPSLSRDRYKNIILDDTLREILVSHLPAGARLVVGSFILFYRHFFLKVIHKALIDSCNSGTMLDLHVILSLTGKNEEPQPHGHKCSLEGDAMSISASFDGQQAWQKEDAKRSLLTKAFLQTLNENPTQTFQGLLQNLNTLISNDLNGAHEQNPQMGFNYNVNQCDLFLI
ncbi:caspase domain-containing protein [Hysterangium stoloniferum]|nr:caspase domain-containing protein [Hysterangium stoloniferum]